MYPSEHLQPYESYLNPVRAELSVRLTAQLKSKEKDLEIQMNKFNEIPKDIAKAQKSLDGLKAKAEKLWQEGNAHKARSYETKQCREATQKLYSLNQQLENLPAKVKKLQEEVAALKVKRSTAVADEKARKEVEEVNKAATEAAQRETANNPPRTLGATAGTKRRAPEEPQQDPKRVKTDRSVPLYFGIQGFPATRPPIIRRTTVWIKRTTAPKASQQPPRPKVAAVAAKAATETTAGAISSTANNAAHGKGEKNAMPAVSPPPSRKATDDQLPSTTPIKAATKNTAGVASSTTTNAADGKREKTTTATATATTTTTTTTTTPPPSSRKAAEDLLASQKHKVKLLNPNKKAGDTAKGVGSDSKISKTSTSTKGATNGTTGAAGKKRKEVSKPSSGSGVAKDAPRRVTRSSLGTRGMEQSKQGAAPINNKKRRASDEDGEERGAKKQKVDQASQPARLANLHQACFSNVIIQLLDAGLGGQDLDALLGGVKNFAPFSSDTARNMIKAVKAAVQAGETEKVSAVKHLREVLAKMHAEYNAQTEKVVDPKVFQLAVAYGVADQHAREAMAGHDQQDAFEYYQMLLNVLIEDPALADKELLTAQFEIETETYDKCLACDHKSDSRIATNNYHGIEAPVEDDDTFDPVLDSTSDLFAQSLYSSKEGECDKCKATQLQTNTSFTKLPDNIVLKVNRARFEKNKATKVDTFIPYADTIYPKKTERYELAAVIVHKGRTPQAGHYIIFREEDAKWFRLNDANCEEVDRSEVKDSGKFGQSAMMLYKRS